jgi:tetratricopeptide (TPR) repeat protein
MSKGKVFISAVTSEFGTVRSAIASNLRAKDWNVTVQDDFRAEPGSDTLLQFIHDHIYDCDRVVCVVGKQSGICPKKPEADRFIFPPVLPAEIAQASYTQWELFFARRYNKKFSIYLADDSYPPDDKSGSDVAGLQDTYVKHLKDQGLHRTPFSTADQLRAAVLTEDWEGEPKKQSATQPRSKPNTLPYPSIGHLFKGREDFLKQLRDSLTRSNGGKTAIFNAVYGLGGIGKTRAATEYAWAHQDDYSALLFAIGETPEILRRNLAALSSILEPQVETTDDNARLLITLNWLTANTGWLLILDNLDSKDALLEAQTLTGQFPVGHVIITSRLSNFAVEVEPLALDVLGENDAINFLLERTKGRRRAAKDDESEVGQLAKELDGLALALEQAGAYIANRKLTFAQYLEQWRTSRDKVMSWSDPAVTHYPRAIAATWQTSVDQLTESGRHLLERLAWLAPEPIPEFLLDTVCPDVTEDAAEAAHDLDNYSLISRDAEGPFFLIHRLVQDVTRRSLDETGRTRSHREALNWINAAIPLNTDDVRFWPQVEPLIPHTLTVVKSADDAAIADPTSRLMGQVALYLKIKALFSEAEPLTRRALAIDEEVFGPDHPDVATRLNNLARLLHDTNRLAEAEPLIRRALAIDEKSFGADHPDVAIDLNNLAGLLQDTNRLAEAEPLIRRALAIDEKNFGPDHTNVATRLNNLAQLLQNTNRLAEAEPLMQRALAIDEKSFGSDHPIVAIRLSNFATLLAETGRITEAEPSMRRALAIAEKSFGPNHPQVAIYLSNLAQLLYFTTRITEAEPLMRRALVIAEKNFGLDHPQVAIYLSNLAQLLYFTTRIIEAEPLMRRALVIAEKSFGLDHPQVETCLSNLAQLLHVTTRSAEAEPLMRRMGDIFTNFHHKYGHQHPNFHACIDNYTQLLKAMGKSDAKIKAAIAALLPPPPS